MKPMTRQRVDRAVISRPNKLTKFFSILVLAGLLPGGWCGLGLRAAELSGSQVDVLIYADGDRVRGRLVERNGQSIVFQSERFGLITVPMSEARVESARPATVVAPAPAVAAAVAPKPVEKAATAGHKHEDPDDVEPVGWARFSPFALTQAVRNFFGPWRGRISVSTDIVADTTDRNSTLIEARLQRKWTRDEIEGSLRYDFAQTADVTTKDLIKVNGSWRRDYQRRLFSVYRPSMEYNRAFKGPGGVPADYVLAQQEIGAGVNIFTTPQRKVRAGLSQNLFDVWVTAPLSRHTSEASISTFAEVEWMLPWKLRLTERGVWYPPIKSETDGWENRIELNKKLTETLSVAIRHETRRNNPDVRIQDYTLLRLLVGLDF